ncbi:M56 family metallopeptidase [Ferruginibacter albus]|uniref:M56 family metallopeptidase n=1 Tax=Ferruginibacter albus TaxID=2875540 RepID=UPI001CC3E8C9|nr:M56 family metallopeptidase [Ferruginibacter albus]UAY51025.1 M48 family metalloprotease [Ferruginibacter albus]
MQPITADSFLLQAVGWAIINSLWQVGILWLLYRSIIAINKNLSAVFKYLLGSTLIITSFIWFTITIIKTYSSLNNSIAVSEIFFNKEQLLSFQQWTNLLPYISDAYLLLLLFFLCRFFIGYRSTILLQKNEMSKVSFDTRMFVRNTASAIGIKKNVQVWLSKNIDVPSVIGFVKPIILLPVAAVNQLSTKQLEAVLLHELAHIKRHDFLLNLIQTFIGTLLFFNPFVLLLSKQVKKERENCCDDWVMNYQYSRHDYANALLLLETQRYQQVQLAMAATGKNGLLKRIQRLFIIEPKTTISISQRIQVAVISLMLLLGISCLFFSPVSKNNTASQTGISISKDQFLSSKPFFIKYQPIEEKVVQLTPAPSVTPLKAKVIRQNKTTVVNKQDEGYTIAIINTNLLKRKKQETAIIPVVNKEPEKEYYIKVEEQQSGNKDMKVYYYELKKDNNKTSVEPIMILQTPVKKEAIKADTTTINKKITS